jgi:hypothetical protein
MASRNILVPGQSSSRNFEEVVAFYFYSVEKLHERNKYSGLDLVGAKLWLGGFINFN